MMKPNTEDIEIAFDEHRVKLLGFCHRLLGNRQAAEDVVQDVFVQVCKAGKSPIEQAWLYQVARNRCVDLLRRGSVWKRIKERVITQKTINSFDDEVVDRSVGWKVLKALPEKMRIALVLRSYVGLDYDQLATVLEIQPASVGVLLSRARKRASQIIEKEMKL